MGKEAPGETDPEGVYSYHGIGISVLMIFPRRTLATLTGSRSTSQRDRGGIWSEKPTSRRRRLLHRVRCYNTWGWGLREVWIVLVNQTSEKDPS